MKLFSIHARSVVVALQARSFQGLAILCILLGAFASPVFAQEATIVGTVHRPLRVGDSAASPLPSRISTPGKAAASPPTRRASTSCPTFTSATTRCEPKAPGFKVAEQKGIVLNVGDRVRVDFQMQVGATQESVTVEANAIRVQSDQARSAASSPASSSVNSRPMGAAYSNLRTLTPGASSVQADFQVPTSAGGDFNVSFNGQRVSHNLWLIDGGEAADRGGGGGADVLPSLDAIAEFRTMTSNYSARIWPVVGRHDVHGDQVRHQAASCQRVVFRTQ